MPFKCSPVELPTLYHCVRFSDRFGSERSYQHRTCDIELSAGTFVSLSLLLGNLTFSGDCYGALYNLPYNFLNKTTRVDTATQCFFYQEHIVHRHPLCGVIMCAMASHLWMEYDHCCSKTSLHHERAWTPAVGIWTDLSSQQNRNRICHVIIVSFAKLDSQDF